jgi:hypothetical protein
MRRASTVSVLLIFGMYILSGSALAWIYQATGNTADTPTGTTLISTGENSKVDYKDANSNPRDVVSGANTFTKLVTTEYGMSFGGTDWANQGVFSSTRGFTKIWPLHYVNNGNAPMTFSVTYEAIISAEAIGWTSAVYLGTGESAPVASGTSFTLAEDEGVSLEVKITSSTEAAHSPDLSSYLVNLYWHPSQKYPAAGSAVLPFAGGRLNLFYYFGVNGLTYGGATAEYSLPDTLKIETAVIKMTRTATTDSPDLYTLGEHDPVPGSLYTISITASNEGMGVANNVVIVDKVPDDMVAYKCNVKESEDNVNVTAPAGADSGGSTGWTFYYTISSEVDVDKDYDGAGWVSLEDPAGELPIPSAATFVKWQTGGWGGADTWPPKGSWVRHQWSCYIK